MDTKIQDYITSKPNDRLKIISDFTRVDYEKRQNRFAGRRTLDGKGNDHL